MADALKQNYPIRRAKGPANSRTDGKGAQKGENPMLYCRFKGMIVPQRRPDSRVYPSVMSVGFFPRAPQTAGKSCRSRDNNLSTSFGGFGFENHLSVRSLGNAPLFFGMRGPLDLSFHDQQGFFVP